MPTPKECAVRFTGAMSQINWQVLIGSLGKPGVLPAALKWARKGGRDMNKFAMFGLTCRGLLEGRK